MRKELQKVKEEIIEGEVVFYFKHLFWRHPFSWEESCFERKGGRGPAPDLYPLFPSSLCPGAEEAGFPLTTGLQKIPFLLSAHPACHPAFPAST